MRLLTLLVVLLAAAPVLADEPAAQPPAAPDAVVVQLARLNATLDRLAAALTEKTRLDLLVRRLELATARAAETERRLDALRDEDATLAEAAEIQAERETTMRARLASGTTRVPPERLEELLAELDEDARRREERQATVAAEVAAMESRLATEQREAADWQDYLDRRLTDL